tara:strand:- start:103 stop:471 length:369 start_codon:yes stop_codon:yes gene_type:complete
MRKQKKTRDLCDPIESANILALQSLLACNELDTLFHEYKQAVSAPSPLQAEWMQKQLHQILLKIPVAVALMPPTEWIKNAGSLVRLLELVNNFVISHNAPTVYDGKIEEKVVFSPVIPPPLS